MGEGDDTAPAHDAELSDEVVVAAGGWCMPTELLLLSDVGQPLDLLAFPKVSVNRGGFSFDFTPPTPTPAQEAYRSLVSRIVDRQMKARMDAIDRAVLDAFRNGWDVHVHEPPQPLNMYRSSQDNALSMLGYVGISFSPAQHAVPTIHYHQEHLDEFDWDDDE